MSRDIVLTRQRALAAGGLLLTGLSGCSSRDDTTETATVGEQSYTGTVDDPTSRTVRNPRGERRGRTQLRRGRAGERMGGVDDDRDVAATFVRLPARFEQVTEFWFGVS